MFLLRRGCQSTKTRSAAAWPRPRRRRSWSRLASRRLAGILDPGGPGVPTHGPEVPGDGRDRGPGLEPGFRVGVNGVSEGRGPGPRPIQPFGEAPQLGRALGGTWTARGGAPGRERPRSASAAASRIASGGAVSRRATVIVPGAGVAIRGSPVGVSASILLSNDIGAILWPCDPCALNVSRSVQRFS